MKRFKLVFVLIITLILLFAIVMKLWSNDIAYRYAQNRDATYEVIATRYANKP